MKHPNAKGHKPRIRPYHPHSGSSAIIKVVRRIMPKAWQLGIMKMGAIIVGKASFKINKQDELDALALCESMLQQESVCMDLSCGEVGNYSMLYADPSRPPPKQNKLHKILQCAAVFFFGIMLLTWPISCKKTPEPTPAPGPTPDTISPVVPGDTITPVNPGDTLDPTIPPDTVTLAVKIDNVTGQISYPSQDTIRKLLAMNKVIIIRWRIPPNRTNSWTPGGFSVVRDTLKTRFAMSPKIYGGEKIYVNENYGGASIPCADSATISKLGMTECDSAIFAGWGYEPTQLHFGKAR